MFYLSSKISHGAGDGTTQTTITLPIAAKLNSVRLCPDVATSKHASNFITASVVDNGGSNIFTVNTSNASGVALVAGTPVSVTLSSSADLEFAAGEVVILKAVDSASGANCAFTVVYEFEPSRGL